MTDTVSTRQDAAYRRHLEDQIKYARDLKLFQDKLRFAIPAAYFAYLGGMIALVARKDTNHTLPYAVSAFIGFGVLLITIAEHYFYCRFRDWEKLLEEQLYWQTPRTGAPESFLSFEIAKDTHLKNNPDLAQWTMVIVVIWISLSVAFLAVYPLVESDPPLKCLATVLFIVVFFAELSVFKWWHHLYKSVFSRVKKLLSTPITKD